MNAVIDAIRLREISITDFLESISVAVNFVSDCMRKFIDSRQIHVIYLKYFQAALSDKLAFR